MRTQLIKASAVIAMPRKLSLLEQMLWNILIANAYDDLLTKDVYRISEKNLLSYWPYDHRHTDRLKEAITKLMSTVLEVNIFEKDKQEWTAFQMLGQSSLKNGICEFRFPPYLRERLHNPEIYAKVNLLIQQRFSSKHGFALYELALDSYKIGQTRWYELKELKTFFGLNSTDYKRYNDFSRRVLKPAIKEVNKQSDLNVSLETRRTGRIISHLKFLIEQKKNFQLKFHIDEFKDEMRNKEVPTATTLKNLLIQ